MGASVTPTTTQHTDARARTANRQTDRVIRLGPNDVCIEYHNVRMAGPNMTAIRDQPNLWCGLVAEPGRGNRHRGGHGRKRAGGLQPTEAAADAEGKAVDPARAASPAATRAASGYGGGCFLA